MTAGAGAREPEGPARPDLSVLIVTWNSSEDIVRCLASVYAAADGLDLDVIVVDNASSDETVRIVRDRFPQVTVGENAANVGFPPANNQALRLARGRHVLYLNPDTEVGSGTLRRCVDALDADPELGMVGCRLVYPDGTTQPEGGRREYRLRDLVSEALWLHMFFPRSRTFARHQMGDWDHLGERDVEAISGAFMMVRREVAESVGGLPDDVFMYHEDLAFCLRVRRAGWRIRYLGDATTTHYSGRSSARSPARLFLLVGVVKVRLIRERQGWLAGAAARTVIAVRSVARLTIAVIGKALPGLGGLRRRHPRVFHARRHALQLVWAVAPRAVRSMMPAPPAQAPAVPDVVHRRNPPPASLEAGSPER